MKGARQVRTRRNRWTRRSVPLNPVELASDVCLELHDNSVVRHSAVTFFKTSQLRDPCAQAARLAEQFEIQNRSLLSLVGVHVGRMFDGSDVKFELRASNTVGAIPLISPTRGTNDYGIVVQPRFPWTGIGPMLAEMGWRVAPIPLKLPLLKRSERRVPPWVISSMVLIRLRAMLDSLTRRFEVTREDRRAPRGAVDWGNYAVRKIASGSFLAVPCTFPDLRDDRFLKGAIRYSIERHIRSLDTQREHGSYVHQLIELGQQLLQRVKGVPPYVPGPRMLQSWLQRPMKSEYLSEGLQAIEWTIEDRGLAGTSDLEGIPWTMPMERFFEAWVETVFQSVALRTGAMVKTGRKRETTHAITWDPPYIGSQKALVPDLWLEWGDTTLIVDAKYKRHFEELQMHSWADVEEQLREEHRGDLFQVLAYGNLARTPRVISCLTYACSPEKWCSLLERGRLIHKAEVAAGSRSIHLWLTAVPMAMSAVKVAEPIEQQLRTLTNMPL